MTIAVTHEGRYIIVTGARGIGAAIAKELAATARVLGATCSGARDGGRRGFVRRHDEAGTLGRGGGGARGPIAGLVNNAGST
jgi:NAD(P)-dependent dehydrogenase (short-subunit alcohol dehydrogenase family)